jgi:hypothetical protein
MADNTSKGQERTFIDIVLGAVSVIFGQAVVEVVKRKMTDAAQKKVEGLVVDSNNQRGELMSDILLMDPQPDALIEEFGRGRQDNTERHLVRLLCKLPRDEKEGRRRELATLNKILLSPNGRVKFEMVMYGLEHDDLVQWARGILSKRAGVVAGEDLDKLRGFVGHGIGKLADGVASLTEEFKKARMRRQGGIQ